MLLNPKREFWTQYLASACNWRPKTILRWPTYSTKTCNSHQKTRFWKQVQINDDPCIKTNVSESRPKVLGHSDLQKRVTVFEKHFLGGGPNIQLKRITVIRKQILEASYNQ